MKGWYRPCVGWLELVLGVLLALDVLGWRTSKEENNARKGTCSTGKLVPICYWQWNIYVMKNCISEFYISMLVCMHMSDFKCRIMT